MSIQVDLRVKMLTLPFAEFELFKRDYFEELSVKAVESWNDKSLPSRDVYDKFLNEKIMPQIYALVRKDQDINNLDEIDLLFNNYYKKNHMITEYSKHSNINSFYISHLDKLSKAFLTHRDGKIILKDWECDEKILAPYEGIHKIAVWNTLNRVCTTDLLVMAYLLQNNMESEEYLGGFYYLVPVTDVQLGEVLRNGLAETHMHCNAGVDFNIIWTQYMTINPMEDSQNQAKQIELDFDIVTGKGEGINPYIPLAALIRIILAGFLDYFCCSKKKGFDFYKFLDLHDGSTQDSWKKVHDILEYAVITAIKGIPPDSEGINIRKCLKEIKFIWGGYKDTGADYSDNWNYRLAKKDVLLKMFDYYSLSYEINTSVENLFLFKALKYLKYSPQDKLFGKLFWQYVRIKNQVFQLVTQGNLVKGLKYFQRYYHRSAKSLYSREEWLWMVIFTQMQNTGVQKIELRITSGKGSSEKEFKKNIIGLLKSFFSVYQSLLKFFKNDTRMPRLNQGMQVPLLGLVIHFIKQNDSNLHKKCLKDYLDLGTSESGFLYYMKQRRMYEMELDAIMSLRESIPGLSNYIVGIDAASIENNTEPWVFAPIYKKARDSKITRLKNPGTGMDISSLGFTFHAGEDFRHILTGLRRIDEVVEHLGYNSGDRIGHGICLGLDVDDWVGARPVIILPRIEQLENLLWVWGLGKEGKITDIGVLEREILCMAERIYRNMAGITVYGLWEAYRKKFETLYDKEEMKEFLYICKKVCKNDEHDKNDKHNKNDKTQDTDTWTWNANKLMLASHCRVYLERMLETIQIEMNDETVALLKMVQGVVKSRLSKKGIVIETNPTSNTAISDIEHLFKHYIQNLNQRRLNNDYAVDKGIMVSINSDDPSVFNTNVTNEFAYIFYSLLDKGYAREDILEWMDHVRSIGIRSSFIKSRNCPPEDLENEIADIIKCLNDDYRVF